MGPPFIDAAQVEAALDTSALVDALRTAFLDPPAAPDRLALPLGGPGGAPASLLVMPAVRAGGLAVVKLVTVHPHLGARPGGAVRATAVALDAATGEWRALIDGHSLTVRRTAAASVLAARTLARPDSRDLLVVGAGAVAEALARAYAEVFPLRSVSVWARRPEAAATLAAALREAGLPARPALDGLDAAVARADLISAATLSETPLICGGAVRPGAHVDLVGGFRPAMREADDALMARARVWVDTPAALAEAGDLVQPIASGALRAADVGLLADALRSPPPREADGVTVFKSVGCALEDLAAAELLLARVAATAAAVRAA